MPGRSCTRISAVALTPTRTKGLDLHPQLANIALLYKSAMQDGISPMEIIIELAGFGATYALMPRSTNSPISVAKLIEEGVMAEPDAEDEG
jgi:hypothetical protein